LNLRQEKQLFFLIIFMVNCLAGCVADYKCGLLEEKGPAGVEGESFAPWAYVQIGGVGQEIITVGNESYKLSPNTACLKSLEVGWTDTPLVTIEIVDEAGGRMGAIVDGIRKCVTASQGIGTEMIFQFGWVLSTCEGMSQRIPSGRFRSQMLNLEVSYAEGKIKYRITGSAASPIFEDMREDGTLGEDDKKISLETAIENICQRNPPVTVRYCELQPDGKLKDVKFKWYKHPPGGPLGCWQADNQNRIATITKWLEDYRLDDGTWSGKGVVPYFSPEKYDELVLLKDPSPKSDEVFACGQNHLGTFIVNGGKCSTVIEFSPTFNWIKGAANFSAGGGTSGPGSSTNNFSEDSKDEPESEHGPTAGLQQQVTISQQAWDAYGPSEAWRQTSRSQQAHARAGRLTEVAVNPIEADLRILGDPREKFCTFAGGKYVSIVAINPFHLQGNGCGDWLSMPVCNQILSNKMWQVLGINHSIKEGSYITTLKLKLAPPGTEVNGTVELGGTGSGGKKVKNTCVS
jgi:hypothetical protein